jgi:hypothetical protein
MRSFLAALPPGSALDQLYAARLAIARSIHARDRRTLTHTPPPLLGVYVALAPATLPAPLDKGRRHHDDLSEAPLQITPDHLLPRSRRRARSLWIGAVAEIR